MTVAAFGFPKITGSENVVRYISKKSRFKGPFDIENGKRTKARLISASQRLYHIHQLLPRQIDLEKVCLIDIPNLGSPC